MSIPTGPYLLRKIIFKNKGQRENIWKITEDSMHTEKTAAAELGGGGRENISDIRDRTVSDA